MMRFSQLDKVIAAVDKAVSVICLQDTQVPSHFLYSVAVSGEKQVKNDLRRSNGKLHNYTLSLKAVKRQIT